MVASRRHSSPPTTVHNKPTTQYPSTPGFISNHWYGRWGQVKKAVDLLRKLRDGEPYELETMTVNIPKIPSPLV
ncbi:hypothetical protein DB836_24125 [Xanthomonas perforans]|nr:hypothetical protein DB854_24085 [Xanthomonas perforans]TQU27894.1 hypothetical protein DB806_22865 [Xanthomonas perforans]TQV31157.1 hypothetical protein DB836_24125 [Xanthomonas perforans]